MSASPEMVALVYDYGSMAARAPGVPGIAAKGRAIEKADDARASLLAAIAKIEAAHTTLRRDARAEIAKLEAARDEADRERHELRAGLRAATGQCCPTWNVARVHRVDCPAALRDAYLRAVDAMDAKAEADRTIAALVGAVEARLIAASITADEMDRAPCGVCGSFAPRFKKWIDDFGADVRAALPKDPTP